MRRRILPVRSAAGLALVVAAVVTSFAKAQGAKSAVIFDRALPAMDGRQLNVKVVDVRYGPGGGSTPHRHGCAVTVYVVSGAMRMGVRGEPDSVYTAGQVFFERPTDIHQVGANASATDSAHFTATFVCDRPGPLTTPVPPA
ncbi:MAG: cupin domain-containing protein [Gemmatimonadaceae bacterium]|nr:cupin domain-containing protein [Gemmatimonadaceae bacterium]